MKFSIVGWCAASVSFMFACNDEVSLPPQDPMDYRMLYMPQAANGAVNKVFSISDEVQEVIYGAYFGGVGELEQDITVNFFVNTAVIDSFNTANATDYQPLPEYAYRLGATEAIIKQGEFGTNAQKIGFITKGDQAMDPFVNYILPVSIRSEQVKINEALRTTFFIVSTQPNLADYPPFNKTNWEILGISSEEANGEGPNNGRAIFAIDDNVESFWHSQWQGASPGPPHYLVIDMGEEKELHGIITKARLGGNAGKPNLVAIETSTDNLSWNEAGTISLADNSNEQKNFLTSFPNARYLKFIIQSSHNATYSHIAEIGAF